MSAERLLQLGLEQPPVFYGRWQPLAARRLWRPFPALP
jgi:hypothetical protein